MKKLLATAFSLMLVFVFVAFPSAEGSEVSYGKTYSLITPSSAAYPDDGIKLTDGIYGTVPDGKTNYYSSSAYVGFNQVDVNDEGNFIIILDLGRVYDDLSAFTVGFLNETSVGIYAPNSVAFAISDERNGEYSDLGRLYTVKQTSDGLSETFAMTLATDDTSGRFVRVTIEHLGDFIADDGTKKTAGWTFIDEISVYSSGNGVIGDISDASADSSSAESIPEDSSSSTPSDEVSDESSIPEPIEPGDGSFTFTAWILLAISSFAMMAALFIKKQKRF